MNPDDIQALLDKAYQLYIANVIDKSEYKGLLFVIELMIQE